MGEIGIDYLCTPFSLKAAYELNQIGVSMFKIGSGEMTDIPTLKKIAELGKTYDHFHRNVNHG